jgi:hypothetical protein
LGLVQAEKNKNAVFTSASVVYQFASWIAPLLAPTLNTKLDLSAFLQTPMLACFIACICVNPTMLRAESVYVPWERLCWRGIRSLLEKRYLLMKLNHINLAVTDLSAAAAFLETYFGLRRQMSN